MVKHYNNAVLTVIAICLVVIAFRGTSVERAVADGPTHVIIDGYAPFLNALRVFCENCR
jgi:hypothetical protein